MKAPDPRPLGRNGLLVSPLTLGTMMFGGPTDEATAANIVDKAFEQGVNSIDTANVYEGGRSEEVVGRLVKARRGQWVLATKFGIPSPGAGSSGGQPGPNDRGGSRHNILQSVDASLRRLGTDYIDLCYLHREDHVTPIAETVRVLGELISQGKIRAYGISNHRGWKLAEFCRTADALGVDRPAASQPLYNLANRQVENEHLPAADYFGVGVIAYSPLARGVLTAKYAPDQPPPTDTRAGRNDSRIHQTEWRPESLDLAQRVRAHAAERGISAGQFALAWVLNNRLVTSAIGGPRTESQWDDYLPALNYAFSDEDERFIDSLVATGHPSTPGYNDPGHPLNGRQPRHAHP